MSIPREPLTATKEVETICLLWPMIKDKFSSCLFDNKLIKSMFDSMQTTQDAWTCIQFYNFTDGKSRTSGHNSAEKLKEQGYLEIHPERFNQDSDGLLELEGGRFQHIKPTQKLFMKLAEISLFELEKLPLCIEGLTLNVHAEDFRI